MSVYVDTSALLKLYVDEPDSDACQAFLGGNDDWVTARHTYVEAHRNLARLLSEDAQLEARDELEADWGRMRIVELTSVVCEEAATMARRTGARSLDALHLAAAIHAGPFPVVTYDRRQAEAARFVGLEVIEPS